MSDETVALTVTSTKRLRIGKNFYEHGDVVKEELSEREVGILLRRGIVEEVSAGDGAEGAPDPADTPSPAGSDEPEEGPDEEEPAEDGGYSEEESEFPRRIGESSMYELSNGEKVRGKAAAQHAENKLVDQDEEDDDE